MKKTAVFLFDLFSNYELSVALSVLAQSGKPFDVFCMTPEAVSEEGLRVQRDRALFQLDIEAYDSLLIPGCMDPRNIIDDPGVHAFLQSFDLDTHIIAGISSSPLLLLKAGLLEGKRYMAGAVKEELLEEGFTLAQMRGMRDITEIKNDDGTTDLWMKDGNLLTAVGSGFVAFGIEFGKMLNLDFEPSWYGA